MHTCEEDGHVPLLQRWTDIPQALARAVGYRQSSLVEFLLRTMDGGFLLNFAWKYLFHVVFDVCSM